MDIPNNNHQIPPNDNKAPPINKAPNKKAPPNPRQEAMKEALLMKKSPYTRAINTTFLHSSALIKLQTKAFNSGPTILQRQQNWNTKFMVPILVSIHFRYKAYKEELAAFHATLQTSSRNNHSTSASSFQTPTIKYLDQIEKEFDGATDHYIEQMEAKKAKSVASSKGDRPEDFIEYDITKGDTFPCPKCGHTRAMLVMQLDTTKTIVEYNQKAGDDHEDKMRLVDKEGTNFWHFAKQTNLLIFKSTTIPSKLLKLLTIQSAPPSYFTLVSKQMIGQIDHCDGISHGDDDHAAMIFSKVHILQALQAKIENQTTAPTNPVDPKPSVPPGQQEDDNSNSDPDYKDTSEYQRWMLLQHGWKIPTQYQMWDLAPSLAESDPGWGQLLSLHGIDRKRIPDWIIWKKNIKKQFSNVMMKFIARMKIQILVRTIQSGILFWLPMEFLSCARRTKGSPARRISIRIDCYLITGIDTTSLYPQWENVASKGPIAAANHLHVIQQLTDHILDWSILWLLCWVGKNVKSCWADSSHYSLIDNGTVMRAQIVPQEDSPIIYIAQMEAMKEAKLSPVVPATLVMSTH
eukprot:jgi/Psemu1/3283/gm1.3283_g